MLLESSRPTLIVTDKNDVIIASFVDGKFETNDPKIIKILLTIEGVEEVTPADPLKGDDFFDGAKFKEKSKKKSFFSK